MAATTRPNPVRTRRRARSASASCAGARYSAENRDERDAHRPLADEAAQQVGQAKGDEERVGRRPGAEVVAGHGVAHQAGDAAGQGHGRRPRRRRGRCGGFRSSGRVRGFEGSRVQACVGSGSAGVPPATWTLGPSDPRTLRELTRPSRMVGVGVRNRRNPLATPQVRDQAQSPEPEAAASATASSASRVKPRSARCAKRSISKRSADRRDGAAPGGQGAQQGRQQGHPAPQHRLAPHRPPEQAASPRSSAPADRPIAPLARPPAASEIVQDPIVHVAHDRRAPCDRSPGASRSRRAGCR